MKSSNHLIVHMKTISQWLIARRIPVLFVVTVLVSAIFVPYFATSANISSLLTQTAIYIFVAVGISFPIIGGGIDLSIGSILFLSGVVYGLLQGLGTVPAALLGVVSGTLAGVINGIIVTRAKVNFFIATLASMVALRGVGLWLTDGHTVPGKDISFEMFGNTQISIGGFPIALPVFIGLVVMLLGHLVMTQSQLGRNIYAIGGNRSAAVLAGINVDRTFLSTFVLSGTMGGMAGVLLASRMASASTLVGEESALVGVSAAVLGGVSIHGGIGTILGAATGLAIIQIVGNILNLLTVEAYFQYIIRGLIVIAVVVFDAFYSLDRKKGWG